MKPFTLTVLAILFAFPFAIAQDGKDAKKLQKQRMKERLEQPLHAEIHAAPETVKAVILQVMMARGYDPDKDTEHEISFTGHAHGSTAYQMGMVAGGAHPDSATEELKFIAVASGDKVLIDVRPDWIFQMRGGETRRTEDTSKDTHLTVLEILDQVKKNAESPNPLGN